MKLLFTVFWRGIQNVKTAFYLFIPLTIILSLLWVAEPLYARYAIDKMVTVLDGERVAFFPLFGWWVCLYLMINIVNGVRFYMRWHIMNHLLAATRQQYYERLLALDIAHHVKARGGELMKKIDNASESTVQFTEQILADLAPSILTAIIFYVISFSISWQLTAVTLLFVPFYVASIAFSVAYTRKNIQKVHALWVTAIGRGYDVLTNIFTVKSSASEERELRRMEEKHREGIRELSKANVVWAIMEGINYFMLMRLVLIGVGMYLLVHNKLSLGSLFFFQFSFFRLLMPIDTVGHMMPRWHDMMEKIRLGEQLYGKESHVANAKHAQKIKNIIGAVSFDTISFAYGDIDAIKGINLDVQAGEHIAFVGHSGAGKSTMAMLINRFYDVTKGAIRIDGIDLKDLDVRWWRSQIGLVLQENVMFNDSILDNIRYGRPEAIKEEVIDAAKRASAHAFIETLPDGYDTMIGERGIRLSGGERQRVAIARAILKQPKIVVLDEATSALDSKTEKEVQEGIKELIAEKTSFIIAHRLSTVQSVDRIAVLDKGNIIACAPHKELIRTCAIYKEMVELQSGGLLAE